MQQGIVDVLAGNSIQRVTREWNAAGLKTTLAGRTQRLAKQHVRNVGENTEFTVSGLWNGPRVRRLLLNPHYAGLKVHRGKVIGSGNWTPLVDVDTHRGLAALAQQSGSPQESPELRAPVYRFRPLPLPHLQ